MDSAGLVAKVLREGCLLDMELVSSSLGRPEGGKESKKPPRFGLEQLSGWACLLLV